MPVYEWHPEELRAMSAWAPSTQMALPFGTMDGPQPTTWAETGEAALAGFRRDNEVYQFLSWISDRTGVEGPNLSDDPSWNPYRAILDTWDEERQKRAKQWIDRGLFNEAVNPSHLDMMYRRLERYEADSEAMAKSGVASFIGSMIGGVASPTTLIGAGWVRGAATLGGAMARGALVNAGQSALQEGILHGLQPLRDWRESVLAIGAAGVLGGGVGGLGHAFVPGHALHPNNPNNPLRVDNLDRTPTEARAPGEEGGDLLQPQSAGAAAAPGDGTVWSAPVPAQLGKPSRPGGGAFFGWTPVGRALTYSAQTARQILTGLMERGHYGSTDVAGIGRAPTAEALKDLWESEANAIHIFGEKTLADASRDLAQLGKPAVTGAEFNTFAHRVLLGIGDSPRFLRSLEEKYGADGVDALRKHVDTYAEQVHRLNEKAEKRLIEVGALRDEKRVSTLKREIDKVAKERDAEVKRLSAEIKTLRKQKGDDAAKATRDQRIRELVAARDGVRTQANERLSALRPDYERERARPAPMGRGYGVAHLYDRATVAGDPAGFEEMVLRHLSRNVDQGWLMETHGLSREGLDELAVTDPAKHSAILGEYGVDGHFHRLMTAERAAEAATAAEKAARLDLGDALRSLRLADRKVIGKELSQAKVAGRQAEAELSTLRRRRDALQREREALQAVMELAGERSTQRALQAADGASQPPRGGFAGDAEMAAHQTALGKLDAALSKLDAFYSEARAKNGVEVRHGKDKQQRAHSVHRSEEDARLNRAVQSAEGKVSDTLDATKAAQQDIAGAPQLKRTDRITALARRKVDMERAMQRADATLRQAEERNAILADALRRAEEAAAKSKAAQDTLAQYAEGAARHHGIVAKDARAALRELKKARAGSPLDQMARDIRGHIQGQNAMPGNLPDDVLPESGRFKERRLNWTPEELEELVERGFLRTDLQSILSLQARQIGGHLGLREALSIGPRSQHRYKSWADVQRLVHDEYDELVKAARDKGDHKAIARINAERKSALDDIQLVRDRLLGLEDPGIDRHGWLSWSSQKLRQANFVRFGSGFLASSLSDVASFGLRHSILPVLTRHLPEIWKTIRSADPSDLKAMVNASELGVHGLSRFDNLDPREAMDGLGIGGRGTTAHAITSRADYGMQKLTRASAWLSVLPAWNRFWKTAAGVQMQYKLRDMVGRYDSLTDFQRADLASLGIGKAEAQRLERFFAKHGQTDERGRFDPNTRDWHKEPDGHLAERDLRLAIERDLRRAIVTPGIGDTPALLDKWYGKLLLQFQTFAFATLNRYFAPMSQRIAFMGGWKDAQVYTSLLALVSMTTLGLMVKDASRGLNPLDRFKSENLDKTAKEIVDRSGMLAWAAPYVDASMKLAGMDGASRFRRNEWWESLGGINLALISQVGQLGASVSADGIERDEWGKVRKKAIALAPFAFHTRFLLQDPDDTR